MKYRYIPLSVQAGDPSGLFAIRLLYLLPAAEPNLEIQCRLVETLIPDYRGVKPSPSSQAVAHIEYKALSYTWGEPEFPKTLYVLSEDQPPRVIKITENLYAALQNLRQKDKTIHLWVDALCINQEDIQERNSQVSNIPQTYTEASGVIVWLGTDSSEHDGQLCLKFLKNLAQEIFNNRYQLRFRGVNPESWRSEVVIYKTITRYLDNEEKHIVDWFLSRPWFRRRWIIQEVVLARKVVVHCGSSTISWPEFELALTELLQSHKHGFDPKQLITLRTMSRIRNPRKGAKMQTPLDTLVEFSDFLCSNDLDRLYALYGVIQHWLRDSSNESQTGIIDYASSIGAVYANFAIMMMSLSRSNPFFDNLYDSHTHVLQLAGALKSGVNHLSNHQLGVTCETIPTWVPDWTGTMFYKPMKHTPSNGNASFGLTIKDSIVLPFQQGGRILILSGVVYDIVTTSIAIDVDLLHGTDDAKRAVNDFLFNVDNHCQSTGFFQNKDPNIYAPTGKHFIAALATTMVANWEHTPDDSYFAQDPGFPEVFLEQLHNSSYHLPEILHKWPAYVDIIRETMRGRHLFLTQSGYIGICDGDVKPHDVVCILSGIKVPFLLRTSNGTVPTFRDGSVHIPGCYGGSVNDFTFDNDAKVIAADLSERCMFDLLGDTYVHGLMNGEAGKKHGTQFEKAMKILPVR